MKEGRWYVCRRTENCQLIENTNVIFRELHIEGDESLEIKYLNKHIIKITPN